MASLTCFFMMLLVILNFQSRVSCDPIDVTSVDDVIKYTNTLLDLVQKYSRKVSGLDINDAKNTLRGLIERNLVFENNLKSLTDQNPDLREPVYEKIDKLLDYLQAVRKLFEEYTKVIRVPNGFDEKRKLSFVSMSRKVERWRGSGNIISMLRKVVPPMITHKVKKREVPKGSHALLYDYLKSIVCIEIERYIVNKYGLNYADKNANAVIDSIKLEREFKTSIDDTIKIFKEIMSITSTKVQRINQKNHLEDGSYTQLKFVFRQFLTNVNLNHACPANDGHLGPTNCSNDTRDFSESFSCQGVLHECNSLPETVAVCSTKVEHRRYEYLKVGKKRYGSSETDCPSKLEVTFSKNCVCDEQTMRSERFFSLDPVMSDVENNYVITGARFVKFNSTVFIQIQEGKLLPFGEIDSNTLRWVGINKNPKETYKLDWKRGREIGLNSAIDLGGYVLTELLLYADKEKNGQKRLQLGAYAHSLDFKFGKLRKSSIFVTHLQPENLKQSKKSIKDTAAAKDNYVKFDVSDFQKDLGQSTIPLIDVQSVTTVEPAPLSGIGVRHTRKNNEDFGFLSLKIFTLVYDSYLELSNENNLIQVEN